MHIYNNILIYIKLKKFLRKCMFMFPNDLSYFEEFIFCLELSSN